MLRVHGLCAPCILKFPKKNKLACRHAHVVSVSSSFHLKGDNEITWSYNGEAQKHFTI